MKYRTSALFWFALIAVVTVMIFFVRKYVPVVLLCSTIIITSLLFVTFFSTMWVLDKKYSKEQRDKKRINAIKKASHYMKIHTSIHESMTLFNRLVTVRFYLNKAKIVFFGVLRSTNREVVIEASSDIQHLVDDVWDYICFYFNRTIDITLLYYICKTNCLKIRIANLPENIDETVVINELNNECSNNPELEYGKSKKNDFNTVNEGDLSILQQINKNLAKKIIRYRSEHGPFYSFQMVSKLFSLKKSEINLIINNMYISKFLVERYKIEQAMDLV